MDNTNTDTDTKIEDFDCPICRELLFRPVSLSCQHIFCLHCIENLKKSNSKAKCPLCRLYFFLPPNYNLLLETIIKKSYSDEYKQREKEIGEMKQESIIRNRITTEILQSNDIQNNRVSSFNVLRINNDNNFDNFDNHYHFDFDNNNDNNLNFYDKISSFVSNCGQNVSNFMHRHGHVVMYTGFLVIIAASARKMDNHRIENDNHRKILIKNLTNKVNSVTISL